MNATPMHQEFLLDDCVEELKNMRNEFQRILQQHKLLLVEHKLLKQKIDEISHQALPHPTATRIEEGRHIVESIIDILHESGKPMHIKEIGEILRSRNIIPIQILNIKTYVNRRLESACAAGIVQIYNHEEYNRKYYYLPDWINENTGVKQLIDEA